MRAIFFFLFLGTIFSFGQSIPEEASRYYYRGIAAMEMAKTPEQYDAAIKEFEQAVSIAPDWPDVYSKLGMAQEKAERYNDAISSYKKYLQLAPDASDAATIKGIIYKLEYKRDLVNENDAKINALFSGFAKRNDGDNYLGVSIKFTKSADGIIANTHQWTAVDFDQTVPVFFDGSTLKFKFLIYHCAGAPALKQYPCESSVMVEGNVIATLPLTIKVKITEIVKVSGFKKESAGEWVFNQ